MSVCSNALFYILALTLNPTKSSLIRDFPNLSGDRDGVLIP